MLLKKNQNLAMWTHSTTTMPAIQQCRLLLLLWLFYFKSSAGQLPAKPKLKSLPNMILRGPFCVLFVFLLVNFSAIPVSGGACEHGSSGRSLLQAITNCPVDIERMNYTILTSRCKAPDYPKEPCCDAFKDFACPYADQINDLTNNCAQVMLSYIETHKYPSTLFSAICFSGINSLPCPGNGTAPATLANTIGQNSGFITSAYSWNLMLTSGATLIYLQLL